jgi:hypothetical protein
MFKFGGFRYGFSGFGGEDSVDRENWKDKSDAAERRENQAKQNVDEFLKRSSTATVFPITEDIVPPTMHLTDACWKTFRSYIKNKGCTCKRRELTHPEIIAMAKKDWRKGKMYIISVTIPTHPDHARAALKEKDATAAAALAQKKAEEQRKAELARQELLRKAQEERDLQAKIAGEYTALVSDLELSTSKKRKVSPVSVSRSQLLSHADKIHKNDLTNMASQIQTDKNAEETLVLAQLSTKWEAEKHRRTEEADARLVLIKDAITASTSA